MDFLNIICQTEKYFNFRHMSFHRLTYKCRQTLCIKMLILNLFLLVSKIVLNLFCSLKKMVSDNFVDAKKTSGNKKAGRIFYNKKIHFCSLCISIRCVNSFENELKTILLFGKVGWYYWPSHAYVMPHEWTGLLLCNQFTFLPHYPIVTVASTYKA